ncbi:MAG: c-type cytochrome [Planctomycetes bacterium]|nr:c-type cytochrome [Planctomycetota bacterium]
MKLHHVLLLIPALALASCGGSEKPSPAENGETPATPEIDLAVGAEYYAITCTPCHGATGMGDGVASEALVPKPRDLTNKEWQASVDDEYLRKIIQYGGAAVGKQPTMPPNPVLGSQPEVLASLIAHVRQMAK